MTLRKDYAVTLMELLIAVSLIGVMSIGMWSIDLFSVYHLKNANRRAQVENDVSFVIEHIAKAIVGREGRGGAIGDVTNPPTSWAISASNAEIPNPYGNDAGIKIWVDKNANGQRDPPEDDPQMAYSERHMSGDPYRFQFWFYPVYPPTLEKQPAVLSYRIQSLKILPNDHYDPYTDFLELEIVACWDPFGRTGFPCGAPENPAITLRARIKAPSVSTR